MTLRSGRGPALSLLTWTGGITESLPLLPGVAKRANPAKRRRVDPQEKGITVLGGARDRVGVVRGGAGTDATNMGVAEAEAVRDEAGTGGQAVGGARVGVESGIAGIGGVIGTAMGGAAAAAAAAVEEAPVTPPVEGGVTDPNDTEGTKKSKPPGADKNLGVASGGRNRAEHRNITPELLVFIFLELA